MTRGSLHARRRLPVSAMLAGTVVAVTAVLLPIASRPVAPVRAFLPAFLTAVVLLDCMSAYLLLRQYHADGQVRVLLFGLAYTWCVPSVMAHALTFPGVLSRTGLFGAGPQTATWLWVTWHGGFLVLLAASALPLPGLDGRRSASRRNRDVLLGLSVVALCTTSLGWLAIRRADLLPTILVAGDYQRLARTVGPILVVLGIAAVCLTGQFATRGGVQSWLFAVAIACLGDVVVTLFARARYTLGWYAARGLALTAASIVLLALLGELSRMYAGLAEEASRLARLAETDELTGLPNRRSIVAAGERAAASATGLSVALVDVDQRYDLNLWMRDLIKGAAYLPS